MKRRTNRDYDKTAVHIVQRFFPQVERVEDGNESVEIEVTGNDVTTGEKMDHAACAMAVACKRELRADGVIMAISTAYIVRGKTATRYTLPQSLARELVSFDRAKIFYPGRYSLSRVTPAKRLGADRNRKINRVTSAAKKYQHHKMRAHLTQGIRATLGSKL